MIFQALTREWDEKTSLEEKRGARAAARKVARVGLYDRNKSLRTVRRKLMQSTEAATDPEVAALAASAARQVQEAASKAIQKSKEELAQEAAGVKRDFSRAEALPEGVRGQGADRGLECRVFSCGGLGFRVLCCLWLPVVAWLRV